MAAPVDEATLQALRGHLSENTRLPAPLIIKVYIACVKEGEWNGNRISHSLLGTEKTENENKKRLGR